MRRVIVDYHSLTPDILKLYKNKYPEGYSDLDVIVFTNTKNETIKAVEITTKDTDYLIKISNGFSLSMENLEDFDLPEDNYLH